jgi:hypothetical protein
MTDHRDDHEEKMALYLAGELPPEQREAFEALLLEAGPEAELLSEELYSQLQLRDALAPAVASASSRLRRTAPPRPWRKAAAMALVAGLAMVAVLLPQFRNGEERTFRGESHGTQLLSAKRHDNGLHLLWTRDPGAARYRVELLDRGGLAVETRLTTDTLLVLTPPPSAIATRWRVIPLDSVGAALPAPPAEDLR